MYTCSTYTCHLTLSNPISVTTVSFSQEAYSIGENEQILTVSVVRSGDTESFVVVLVASHPDEGTATGMLLFFLCCTFLCLMFSSSSHVLSLPFPAIYPSALPYLQNLLMSF